VTGPDAEILQVFFEEATARLDRMVDMLLALESGSPAVEAVEGLFREAHSIKGSAAMLGVREAASIAHAIEDVLAHVRGRDAFPVALTDPLLHATDSLRRAVAGEQGVEAGAVAELAASRPGSADAAARGPAAKTSSAAPSTDERGPAEPRSIRASADKVDRLLDAVGETVLHHRRIEHLLGNGSYGHDDERIDEELRHGELLVSELQDSVIQMRTLPLSSITGALPRAVRDLARANGIEVELQIAGADTQLDRMILDGISDAIAHLLRNAIAHGIEPPEERTRLRKPVRGRVELCAEQRGSLVAIAVSDDGRGVSAELLGRAANGRTLADVLGEAGLSTAAQVTDVAGRGVGLNAVKSHIESLGGELEIESTPGRGTAVTLTIPLTLALVRVLLLQRGAQMFGLPLNSVEEAVTVAHTTSLSGRESIELRGRSIPLTDLALIIGAAAPSLPDTPKAVIVASSGRRVAVACDRIVEEQEVVIKSLGPLLARVAGYLGAAILGDGGIALILDPRFVATARPRGTMPVPRQEHPLASKVLVVDDQFTVRELQRSILEAAGYRVATARDGSEALARVVSEPDVALVLTDIEMPEMDGIELLRSIRSEPQRSTLPVVVVTARDGEEDRRRGAEAGADAYIVKGEFDQQALLATVGRLLTR
jgi:two-component system, chemotaxis family, sensor kinase CheA